MSDQISHSDILVIIYESIDEIGEIVDKCRREMKSGYIARMIVNMLVEKIKATQEERNA